MPGGLKDSSKTRVCPVFTRIEQSGEDWVRRLMALPRSETAAPRQWSSLDLRATRTAWGRNEEQLAPPHSLLTWMVSNPSELRQQTSDVAERQRFLGGEPQARDEAIAAITSTKRLPSRAWYMLKGWSQPDAYIETPDAVIVVEGKRTERKPDTRTTWLEGRHQLWRHIDDAWEIRGTRAVYGFFVVGREAEQVTPFWRGVARDFMGDPMTTSLRHRSDTERAEMASTFLGITSWRAVCDAFGIPMESLPADTTQVTDERCR